jgi:competence protein ComEA
MAPRMARLYNRAVMRTLSILAALSILTCATVTFSQDGPPEVKIIPARININTASREQLGGLEGVDFEIAEKIIAGRPYKSVRELMDRKILTETAFARIMKRVDVRPSVPIFVMPGPRPKRYIGKPPETRQVAYGF